MSTVFHNVLRAVSGAMELPVVILLILLLAFAVFSVGWIIAEFFSEHRHMKEDLPALLEHLRDNETDLEAAIAESKLNRRQKATLQELTQHPDFTRPLLDDLADNLLEQEQAHDDHMIKFTDLASKLGPMLGLLGPLIPLGPGIIALGQGDTDTLSVSLMTAFDTTVAGLCIAAVCMIVSTIRRRWYAAYMADLETLTSCVCERVKPQ